MPVLLVMLIPVLVAVIVLRAVQVVTAPLWVPVWAVWRAGEAVRGWCIREEPGNRP